MQCFNCRTTLPDDAAFCFRCGTPQKALATSKATPLAHRQESPRQDEIVVEVVGTQHRLTEGTGLLVVYGSPKHKEALLEVMSDEPLRRPDGRGYFIAEKVRMREHRVGGFSVIVGIIELPPEVYSLELGGNGMGRYHTQEVKIESGDVTEIDFRD